MRWHPDEDCDAAIVRLLDALCMWERSTGRESMFVLIPVEQDEAVVIADSGKPLGPAAALTNELIAERVLDALKAHDDPNAHNFMGT